MTNKKTIEINDANLNGNNEELPLAKPMPMIDLKKNTPRLQILETSEFDALFGEYILPGSCIMDASVFAEDKENKIAENNLFSKANMAQSKLNF